MCPPENEIYDFKNFNGFLPNETSELHYTKLY